jgi:hypothetical protein
MSDTIGLTKDWDLAVDGYANMVMLTSASGEASSDLPAENIAANTDLIGSITYFV